MLKIRSYYIVSKFTRLSFKDARKLLLSAMTLIGCLQLSFGQDLHFSQFFEAPLLRNPALAGMFPGDVRAQMVYRNQWNSFTNAYKSGSLNAEYKMPVGEGSDFMTAGIQMLYDKAGTVGLTSTHVLPALNYHKSTNADKNAYLSFGFMGGLVQKRIDRSKITTNAQFDGLAYNPALANGEVSIIPQLTYFDGAFGLSYNSSFGEENKHGYFVGAAYHHFHRPKSSFYRNSAVALNPKMVFSGGLKLSINETTFFTFQADHSQQGAASETIGGFMYSYKTGDYENPDYVLHGGLLWRWKDALIPVIKVDYNPFSFSFSYDVNLSQLKTASQARGGFEMGISYIGFLERDNSSKYKMQNPRF
jgi:type IX secretion system PorP/SprF family membrane protein